MKPLSLVILLPAAIAVNFLGASGENHTRNVAIFLQEGVEILDIAGPGEVFAATHVKGQPMFNVYTVAATAEAITSQGFVKITPEYTIETCPKPDIVVFSGGGSSRVAQNPRVIAWLEETAPDLQIAMSVCTGAFVLAKAGLLEGKKATTWHNAIERLRRDAPNTEVLENTRFVDNGQVVTTAGVSAGIDGALHMVSRLLGEDVARATARYMEYDKWVPEAGHVVEAAPLTRLRRGESVEANQLQGNVFPGELRNLGHELLEQGNAENALTAFEMVLRLHPDLSPTLLDIGKAHEKVGDKEQAEEYFLQYLAVDPTDLEIVDKIGFDRSLGFFNELASNGGLDEHSVNMLGYRLMMHNRMPDAIRIFKLNIEAYPDSWNVYDSLGEAYMVNGDKKLAIENYQKSLELNPDNSNARTMLGKLDGTY